MLFTIEKSFGDGSEYTKALDYRIEFQHINRATKHGAKRLATFDNLHGLTICVVSRGEIVSIAVVFCGASDSFKKEEGRIRALRLALVRCKPFREDIEQVLLAYENRPRPMARPSKKAKQSVQPLETPEICTYAAPMAEDTGTDAGGPL